MSSRCSGESHETISADPLHRESLEAPKDGIPTWQQRSLRGRLLSTPGSARRAGIASARQLAIPHWRYDARLDQASANDWGIFYINDETFRNIISSYLVWDHPAWRFFDEDDFLDGLVHSSSVSCNECLVHAVIAFGSVSVTRSVVVQFTIDRSY